MFIYMFAFCLIDKVMPMEFVAKVIKFGRVTIPQEIRELLSIDEGDYVVVEIEKVKKRKGWEVIPGDALTREGSE